MFVISRSTSFTYRDKRVDAKQIGRELGVRYVLEGSVRRSGTRVRINTQLIDAVTDAHLWADRFDGDTRDLFALQDEVTSRIAISLNLELVAAEVARPTGDPDALDYILRGRAALSKPGARDNYAEAISLYERAFALDPKSVEAQTRLAGALAGRIMDNMTDSAAADILRAAGLIGQAMAASPHNPIVRFVQGQVLRAQNRFSEAIAEYEASLALNRNLVSAYAHIGRCKLFTGSAEETILLHGQAIRLSPRDPQIHLWYGRIGQAHLVQSRVDQSILWFEKARNANPVYPLHHTWLAAAYALKGDSERAADELTEAKRTSGSDRYSSIARLQASGFFAVASIRMLFEPTLFAGLRKAGMPEE
jgi:adenylate cyclase